MTEPTDDERHVFSLAEMASAILRELRALPDLEGIHIGIMLSKFPSMTAAATCTPEQFIAWMKRHLELMEKPDAKRGEAEILGEVRPIIMRTRGEDE